ncbi:Hypothetical predicted protein [Cloeon dipterum]|uniref:SOCS box domain-containing protein n=1 Tax=Cloeon dipterum TaxID=197152 RepID=A0A8S1DU00_9INSE|nr:Hypothetical predicted protein [Cloeon dipterum]
MATPAKRPCLESNGESSKSSTGICHSSDCRGTIEEADALANDYLKTPNLDKASNESNQLLSAAIKSGHFNCVESLLNAGIDVNGEYCNSGQRAQVDFPKTALVTAILKNRFNVVKLLVSRGARVNPLPSDDDDNLFRYPLFHALNRDNPEMVTLLIELGADPNRHPAGRHGISLTELALQTGRKKIFKILVENGARVTKPYSYLTLAVSRRDMDTFKCLIKHDAFLNRHRRFEEDDGLDPNSVLLSVLEAHIKSSNCFTRQNVTTFLNVLKQFGFNFWSPQVDGMLDNLRNKGLPDIVDEISNLRSRMQTLKEIARVAIQRNMGVELPRQVKHMNLPQELRRYLAYKDVDRIAVLQDNLPKNTIMISGDQRQLFIFNFPNRQ